MIVVSIKKQWTSYTHWKRHVTNDILTTCSNHLKTKQLSSAATALPQNACSVMKIAITIKHTKTLLDTFGINCFRIDMKGMEEIPWNNHSDHKEDPLSLLQLVASLIPHHVCKILSKSMLETILQWFNFCHSWWVPLVNLCQSHLVPAWLDILGKRAKQQVTKDKNISTFCKKNFQPALCVGVPFRCWQLVCFPVSTEYMTSLSELTILRLAMRVHDEFYYRKGANSIFQKWLNTANFIKWTASWYLILTALDGSFKTFSSWYAGIVLDSTNIWISLSLKLNTPSWKKMRLLYCCMRHFLYWLQQMASDNKTVIVPEGHSHENFPTL